MKSSTWQMKLSDGTTHLFYAFDFYNACRMAMELTEKQFPQSQINGIEKYCDEEVEGAWKYPFPIAAR